MKGWLQRTALIAFIGLCLFSTIAQAMQCHSPYKGKKLTREMVENIISMHEAWLASEGGANQQQANLCGTHMSGINLSHVNLSQSNLAGADLSKANLSEINLSQANLTKTFFRWSNLSGANLTRANLSGAILIDTNLSGIDLSQVNLEDANLSNADLSNANLRGATLKNAILADVNLKGAHLIWSNFTNADLNHSDLSNANFENSTFTNANLTNADITNSNFNDANLTQAKLIDTHMENAHFAGANLKHTVFQPTLAALPNLMDFMRVKNFSAIRFHDFTTCLAALTAMRNTYKKLNIRSMERRITSIIKYQQMTDSWEKGGWGYVEAAFGYVLFYLPSDYGAMPGRSLRIFLVLILLFALPYYASLRIKTKKAGITITWHSKRLYRWQRTADFNQANYLTKMIKVRPTETKFEYICESIRLMGIALFFSLLSAFRMGWRDINLSNWLTGIQTRHYILKAKGWVRVVAGFQALISAYLVVLWIFTYFGHPFEW